MRPIFIECTQEKLTEDGPHGIKEHINHPVNPSFVHSIQKEESLFGNGAMMYPESYPSIVFKGTSVVWLYNDENTRDMDHVYLMKAYGVDIKQLQAYLQLQELRNMK